MYNFISLAGKDWCENFSEIPIIKNLGNIYEMII